MIVGHCTFCALMCRCSLAIFHGVYAFTRAGYQEAWPMVKPTAGITGHSSPAGVHHGGERYIEEIIL